jgi:hypothetical protein
VCLAQRCTNCGHDNRISAAFSQLLHNTTTLQMQADICNHLNSSTSSVHVLTYNTVSVQAVGVTYCSCTVYLSQHYLTAYQAR